LGPIVVDLELRAENQWLRVGEVLGLLRQQLPAQAPFAKVHGLWVWVTFPEAPLPVVRSQLSQLGFTWNNNRRCWQHPCGQFRASSGSAASHQR
jgi:hypothetical protein